MATAKADFELGDGLYSFPEAADIIIRSGEGATARQMHYWVKTGLTPARSRTHSGVALSFEDLVSLELVRRFRTRGVSLQRVRRLEARLRDLHPTLERPFANRVFFTDGVNVWIADNPDDPEGLVEEIVGRHPGNLAWTGAIRSFTDEIHFNPQGEAVSWSLNDWVEINPAVQFGAPVVRGTRVPARTIAANLAVGTIAQVADWYALTVEQVEGVKAYFAAA